MLKLLTILLAFFSLVSAADMLKVSSPVSRLDEFTYETPFGEKVKIPDGTKTLIISYEKDTGRLVNKYLNSKYPPYLARYNAVFIADIHDMPSIITKLFALPKMKKYKHTIYLHYGDKFSEFVVPRDEKVTIVKIKDKKVESIKYISTVKELKEAIEY
jgi:hypothetical protein